MTLTFALLSGCGRQPAPTSGFEKSSLPNRDRIGDFNEFRANVEGAKRSMSAAGESNAGPPIHLNPYVVSPPKGHHHETAAQEKTQGGKPH
jgi:hypothetical protein